MDVLKQIFPFAWKWGKADQNGFVVGIIISAIVLLLGGGVFNLVAALVSFIPVLPVLISVVGSIVGLYALVTLVLTILVKCDVLKD